MTTDRLERHLRNTGKQAFVLSSNTDRRNMSPEQKVELRKTQKAIALQLREADAKRWTLKNIAKLFGVRHQMVAEWFGTSNSGNGNASKPDARLSIPKDMKPVIAERIEAGGEQGQGRGYYCGQGGGTVRY